MSWQGLDVNNPETMAEAWQLIERGQCPFRRARIQLVEFVGVHLSHDIAETKVASLIPHGQILGQAVRCGRNWRTRLGHDHPVGKSTLALAQSDHLPPILFGDRIPVTVVGDK